MSEKELRIVLMPKLIDAHTHIQFPQFNNDREEVIKRTLEQDVWMINVGADKKSSQKAVELTRQYPNGVFSSIGVHPHNINEGWDYDFYKKLGRDNKVVAIGECGLDYKNNEQGVMNGENKEKQERIFVSHIKLAKEVRKPLMIHCRDAFPNLIEILITHNSLLNTPPGIVHFFTGVIEDAKKLLEMDFYFTFGGLITFNRSFDEIIKFIPLERILLETDAPYVSPEPYRGKRNEPLYVVEVAKKLAEVKNLLPERVSEQTTINSLDVFGILK